MKKTKQTVFPKVLEIQSVDFDSDGFWPTDSKEEKTEWAEIEEVCIGYWIHEIAIVDFYFTGFRTEDELKTIWVEEGNDRFDQEIKRRYPHGSIPARVEWQENDRCIQSYVICPKERIGEAMYSHAKERWFSKSKLTYKTRAKQSVDTTAVSALH